MSITTGNAEVLLSAVEDLRGLLLADGVTLRVVSLNDGPLSVELAIDFAGVDCEECVLPPDQLREAAAAVISRNAGCPVDVVLRDPRRIDAQSASGQSRTDRPWVEVLDPTGVAPDTGAPNPGPDAGQLRGKTIAIRHDVLWRSFDWTVEEWAASLEAAGATVLTWRRVQGLVGADYEQAQGEYEAMLAKADMAISGLANCGSCTSWSVRDTLTALACGLPAVAVATRHFEPLAKLLAQEGGRPGMRLLVLPYPYDTLPEAEVRAQARHSFPQLLAVLGATV